MTCNVTMTYRHYDVTYFNGEIPDIVEKRTDIQGKLTMTREENARKVAAYDTVIAGK